MQNEMQVMDPTGHTTVKWNPKNEDEVETARKVFDEMTGKGYSAFRTGITGRKGQRLRSFDPQAKGLILIPQLVGG